MHTLPSTLPQTFAKQNGPTSRSGVHSKSMRSPGLHLPAEADLVDAGEQRGSSL